MARFSAGSIDGVVEALSTLLGQRKPCMVVLDIDGTITEKRGLGHFRVDIGVIEGIRVLEDYGVVTVFATGNSASVAAGLARYIGSSGPQVAENGCIVFYRGTLWSTCKGSARAAARIVEEELAEMVIPSWQNKCRLHDYAFTVKKGFSPARVVDAILDLLAKNNVKAKVGSSGYAVHLRPLDASKANGLKLAESILGFDESCVVAVGDSSIDVEMRGAAGVLVAVGNADRVLVDEADIVVEMPSGQATRMLLEALTVIAKRTS